MTEHLNLILPLAFAGSVSAVILIRAAVDVLRRTPATQPRGLQNAR